MWPVIHYIWHGTRDMWQVTGGRRWTFSQNFSYLALMVWELEVTCDTWHLRPDTWHLTPDTWHMTCVTWHTRGDEHCVKISGPLSSFGFCVKMSWRFWTKGSLTDWINWLINYEAVCRTAPATPGLSNILGYIGLGHPKFQWVSKLHHWLTSFEDFAE